MKTLLTACVWLALGGLVLAEEPAKMMLSHDVFFTLTDNSAEAKAQLVAGCQKYLSKHEGIVWFAAGARGPEFQREVNDQEFDVALHIVFESKADHDRYAIAPDHMKFIEEFKANWAKVRVFDSYLAVSSHGNVPMPAEAKQR